MKDCKFEAALAAALAAALVCALAPSEGVAAWWAVAFEPLCGGILTAEAAGEDIILRSRLWEWLLAL